MFSIPIDPGSSFISIFMHTNILQVFIKYQNSWNICFQNRSFVSLACWTFLIENELDNSLNFLIKLFWSILFAFRITLNILVWLKRSTVSDFYSPLQPCAYISLPTKVMASIVQLLGVTFSVLSEHVHMFFYSRTYHSLHILPGYLLLLSTQISTMN